MNEKHPKSSAEKGVMAGSLLLMFIAIPFLLSSISLKHKVENVKYDFLTISSERIHSYTCIGNKRKQHTYGFKITITTEKENKSKVYVIPLNPRCSIDEKWAIGKNAKIYRMENGSTTSANSIGLGDDVWQVVVNDKFAVEYSEKVAHVKRYVRKQIILHCILIFISASLFTYVAWPTNSQPSLS